MYVEFYFSVSFDALREGEDNAKSLQNLVDLKYKIGRLQ